MEHPQEVQQPFVQGRAGDGAGTKFRSKQGKKTEISFHPFPPLEIELLISLEVLEESVQYCAIHVKRFRSGETVLWHSTKKGSS